MRKTKWLLACLASGALAFEMCAADVAPAAAHRPLGGQLLERARQKLELTDAQTAQIRDIVKGERATLAGLLARLHQARLELRAAVQAAGGSDAMVRAASAKVAEAEADLAVERHKLFGRISPILTAEQQAKLKTLQDRKDKAADALLEGTSKPAAK